MPSVGNDWFRGYKDPKYSMCGEHEETVAHICECEGVERKTIGKKRSNRMI